MEFRFSDVRRPSEFIEDVDVLSKYQSLRDKTGNADNCQLKMGRLPIGAESSCRDREGGHANQLTTLSGCGSPDIHAVDVVLIVPRTDAMTGFVEGISTGTADTIGSFINELLKLFRHGLSVERIVGSYFRRQGFQVEVIGGQSKVVLFASIFVQGRSLPERRLGKKKNQNAADDR